MNVPTFQKILLSPGFLLGLLLLLANDLFLKHTVPGFLTGKLSDIAGLFIFPLFLCGFFAKSRRAVYISTALFFVFWKSPYSTPLIQLWSALEVITVGRTIDYFDLPALLVLPFSYRYLLQQANRTVNSLELRQRLSFVALLVSVFAFTATTLVRDRSIHLGQMYLVLGDHRQIQEGIQRNIRIRSIQARRDDERFSSNVYADYPRSQFDPKVFFFDFEIIETTCASQSTKGSFIVREKGIYSEVWGIWFEFECGDYENAENSNALDKKYEAQLTELFHREILANLTQYEQQ